MASLGGVSGTAHENEDSEDYEMDYYCDDHYTEVGNDYEYPEDCLCCSFHDVDFCPCCMDGYAKYDQETLIVNIVPIKTPQLSRDSRHRTTSVPQDGIIHSIVYFMFPYILNFSLLFLYICIRTCKFVYCLLSFTVFCLSVLQIGVSLHFLRWLSIVIGNLVFLIWSRFLACLLGLIYISYLLGGCYVIIMCHTFKFIQRIGYVKRTQSNKYISFSGYSSFFRRFCGGSFLCIQVVFNLFEIHVEKF